MSAHQVIQYLQQNTQEMDLLSSPDATQGGGKQNDRFGGKRKDGHRRGWDRGSCQGCYSLVKKMLKFRLRLKVVMVESRGAMCWNTFKTGNRKSKIN